MNKRNLFIIGFTAGAMILIALLTSGPLSQYKAGIIPRTESGLPGILLSPFFHAGFGHLMSNLMSLIPLMLLTSLTGRNRLVHISLFVILLSGLLTWLLARNGLHLGASGLVFGLWGYLMANAWFSRNVLSISIGMITGLFFGGILLGLAPRFGISFEGHAFGLLAGVIAGWLFSHKRWIDQPSI